MASIIKRAEALNVNYVLTIILIIGAVLRLYHIDFQSVWLDEIHTLNDANPSFSLSEVYTSVLNSDQHPPLYFYCIHFLFKIFGYTPVVARLFSALIGIITIYAMYKLGKEMFNKEVGIISSVLIAVNPFHIYHSQEARPYTMLCLFTILSFFYLIRFIRIPSRKNSVFYGLATALMLYGHFFALFGLLSQMFILGFFLFLSEKKDKKVFLIHCLIAGLIALILFLPSYHILIAATKIKQFWIPMPTGDTYLLIFKEFFGYSKIVLLLINFLLLFYFVRIFKRTSWVLNYTEIVENEMLFGFIILMPWIVIVVITPLILSYVSVPMIVSRYFISLLPAFLILIALGIYQFKNQTFRWGILGLVCVFTLSETIISKKYYTRVSKTQFREVTQFIINNNKNSEPVVTSLQWYYTYFLHNGKVNMNLINQDLESYINEMIKNPTSIKSFWYTDAHGRPYALSETAQKFVKENFIVDKDADLIDAWTKHFVPIFSISMDISKYKHDLINFNVENYTASPNEISISGFAYLTDIVAAKSSIFLVFMNNRKSIKYAVQKIKRDDVTTYFKSAIDISNSGFSSKIDLTHFEKGNYRIGILVTNEALGKQGLY